MTMTVLSVAYPFAEVSVDTAGGAEQVLSVIDQELVQRGHRSIVVGCKRSRISGELVAFDRPAGALTLPARAQAHIRYRALIDEAISRYAPDIVHMHGVDAFAYLPPESGSTLLTLHLPRSFYALPQPTLARPLFFSCVSESQKRGFADIPAPIEVVPNGVRVDDYGPPLAKEPFALALGRICPEKGYHLALDAAKLADIPLILAGQVFPFREHEDYFLEEIVPRLDGPRRFVGPVDLEQKRRLLAKARCLVIPSLVPETSSLVAMEALASGTPVIAHRIGALPDIINPGVTGYLVDDVEEMARAMLQAHKIDSNQCRQIAAQRFSAERMVSAYLELYERLIQP